MKKIISMFLSMVICLSILLSLSAVCFAEEPEPEPPVITEPIGPVDPTDPEPPEPPISPQEIWPDPDSDF